MLISSSTASASEPTSAFKRRFRGLRVAEVVADALHDFSLDIVGIVCGYALCGVAAKGATPAMLFSFAQAEARGRAACSSLCCADGFILMGDDHGVQMFSSQGKFIRSVVDDRDLGRVTGLAFNKSSCELFVVVGNTHSVCVCALFGGVMRKFGEIGHGKTRFIWPWQLAINDQGLLFIVDSENRRVQVVRADGSYVREFGNQNDEENDSEGEGEGEGAGAETEQSSKRADEQGQEDETGARVRVLRQLNDPRGIVINSRGEVIVGDINNEHYPLQVFDQSGKFLRKFSDKQIEYRFPTLALDREDNLFVTAKTSVDVYSADGSFLTTFGAGQFRFARCVCVDPDGRILVGDEGCRVHVFAFEA